MREIQTEELRVIQLDILSAVDEFCRANSLHYSLNGGTFIGAVRHKGYIPWDNDIDIMMYRTDYDRFIAEFPADYKGCYSLCSLEKNPRWDFPYAKVLDTRTGVQEHYDIEESSVSIDIFPIDDVPDDEKHWNRFKRRMLFWHSVLFMKRNSWKASRGLLKNLLLVTVKTLTRPWSKKRFIHKCASLAVANNGKGYGRAYSNSFGVYGKRPFRRDIFDEYTDYPFENRSFMGVKDFDEYLGGTFGDYMQLPPVEKRVDRHPLHAWWKD